jgi:hypothetical protein
MARVHLRCLQQWLERRRADPALSESAAFSCEVCKAPYRLHVRERLNLTLEALCSCASLGFYAEFATILVTLAAMVALFYLFAYSQNEVSGTAIHTRTGAQAWREAPACDWVWWRSGMKSPQAFASSLIKYSQPYAFSSPGILGRSPAVPLD